MYKLMTIPMRIWGFLRICLMIKGQFLEKNAKDLSDMLV